jgi:NADH-quinone oxidoreductase subunit E
MPELSTKPEDDASNAEDLCLTCAHVDDCVHREAQSGPVMFCEMFEEGSLKRDHIAAIVDKYAGSHGAMISILEAIQANYGYLPESALKIVAAKTGASLVDIYGVATFYRAFSLTPRGKHLCSVCMGTACHVRGAPAVAKELEQRLQVKPGETTDDREYTLETVNCLGACALGPVVVVDGHYFPQVGTRDVEEILDKTEAGLDFIEVEHDKRVFPVEVCCARCNHSLMDPAHSIEGYPAVRVTISFGRKHGWLRLSSLYGSYTIESEHEIPHDTVAHFFCPFCHAELAGAADCPTCSAPMVPLIVRGGGMIQICSRRGCKTHMLDITGASL